MTKFSRGHVSAAKATPVIIMEIRRLYEEEGWSQGRIARECQGLFGIQLSVVQIGRIVRYECWQQFKTGEQAGKQEVEHSQAMLQMNTVEPVVIDPQTIERLKQELAREQGIPLPEAGQEPADPIAEYMARNQPPAHGAGVDLAEPDSSKVNQQAVEPPRRGEDDAE